MTTKRALAATAAAALALALSACGGTDTDDGATGGETATGNAQRASGPSGSYGGKVAAKVKPNIVFTEDIAGNPTADVEVRTSPDGTIISRKLVKSSGNKAWDDAVLRAIDKTETLPRDVDGRVPPNITIGFRPRD